MKFRTTQRGAVAGLSPDDASLVDLVIRAHDAAHGRDIHREIADPERGEMIVLALLGVARRLTGWSDDLLRDLAKQLGRHESAALRALAPASLSPSPQAKE